MGLLQYLFSTSKNPGNILIFINLSRYWKSESFWYFWLTSKYLLYDVTKVCLYNHALLCRYFFSHKYDIKFILVCIWINFRLNTFDWCNSNTTERKKFAQNNVSFTLKIFSPFCFAAIPWPTPPHYHTANTVNDMKFQVHFKP